MNGLAERQPRESKQRGPKAERLRLLGEHWLQYVTSTSPSQPSPLRWPSERRAYCLRYCDRPLSQRKQKLTHWDVFSDAVQTTYQRATALQCRCPTRTRTCHHVKVGGQAFNPKEFRAQSEQCNSLGKAGVQNQTCLRRVKDSQTTGKDPRVQGERKHYNVDAQRTPPRA